jgi:hypothetical protein
MNVIVYGTKGNTFKKLVKELDPRINVVHESDLKEKKISAKTKVFLFTNSFKTENMLEVLQLYEGKYDGEVLALIRYSNFSSKIKKAFKLIENYLRKTYYFRVFYTTRPIVKLLNSKV